jgi:hypothetical protein
MTKRRFVYEYKVDETNSITIDYSPEGDDTIETSIENGIPFLYLNRLGMITLARILIKMATGDHQEGFHVHLRKHFNADLPECLTVLLAPDDAPPYGDAI